MSRKLTETSVRETGDRVISGSVRPDGTVRKERRIRAGFIPQDEQPVYQSTGALAKQNVPTCPGMDEAEIAALKQQSSRGKKASSSSSSDPPKPKPAANAQQSAKPAAASVGTQKAPAMATAATVTPSAPTEPENPEAALDKQIRNLKKKIRQCSDLAERKQSGAQLDKDQEEKLAKSEIWQQEVEQLEAQLAKLGM